MTQVLLEEYVFGEDNRDHSPEVGDILYYFGQIKHISFVLARTQGEDLLLLERPYNRREHLRLKGLRVETL